MQAISSVFLHTISCLDKKQIIFDEDHPIGEGSQGTFVYK